MAIQARAGETELHSPPDSRGFPAIVSATAYIGLGSNLGDRRDYLAPPPCKPCNARPVSKCSACRPITKRNRSAAHRARATTSNAAAELRTELEADELLRQQYLN